MRDQFGLGKLQQRGEAGQAAVRATGLEQQTVVG